MLKEPTKKEIDAYFKRVEDPTNYSSERWWHLTNSWMDHIYRIMVEKKWIDDGSAYYMQLINILHQVYETPLHDFVIYYAKESPNDDQDFDEIEQMVKKWKPCNKEIAMEIFEYIMDDFEEIWQEQEDKKIQPFKDDITWLDNFTDIQNPVNWKKVEIAFKKSNMGQMKYRYDGKESDWINVVEYIMHKQNNKKQKHFVKVLETFCAQGEYHLPVVGKEIHDIIYRANQLLKDWFLPNAPTGMKYNPIYSMGPHRKRGFENIRYTRYLSHIQFSYQS